MKRKTSAALVALLTTGASVAWAQSDPGESQASAPASDQADQPAKRPARRTAAVKKVTGPVATFPGFHALPDGRSEIYVEITSPVAVAESRARGTLTYRLKGARVTFRNNKNALITTHFSTPVGRARLVPAQGDLNLIIDLRADVTATYRMVSTEAGTARLEVVFPAGQYPTQPMRFLPPAKKGPAEPEAPEGDVDTPSAKKDALDRQTKKKPPKADAKGMGPPVP